MNTYKAKFVFYSYSDNKPVVKKSVTTADSQFLAAQKVAKRHTSKTLYYPDLLLSQATLNGITKYHGEVESGWFSVTIYLQDGIGLY